MKKKTLTIVIILLVLIVSIGIFLNTKKSTATPNSTILNDQTVEGILFKNAKLTYEKGTSILEVEVYNETDQNITLSSVSINFEQEGGEIITLKGNIGNNLRIGMGKTMIASKNIDLTKSINVTYVINK